MTHVQRCNLENLCSNRMRLCFNCKAHHLLHSAGSWRVWASSRIRRPFLCGSASVRATSSPAAQSAPANTRNSQWESQASFRFTRPSFHWPEASPEPSSLLRRSRGRGCVLSELEPRRWFCVKQRPFDSRFLCSPGCPQQFPALWDDA